MKSDNLLKDSQTYTIGTIEKIEPAGTGLRVYISFFYKGKKYVSDYIEGLSRAKKLEIGTRFFIKIVPNALDRAFDFNIDCKIPDSIKSAPYEGWNQEWLQKYFPDCDP